MNGFLEVGNAGLHRVASASLLDARHGTQLGDRAREPVTPDCISDSPIMRYRRRSRLAEAISIALHAFGAMACAPAPRARPVVEGLGEYCELTAAPGVERVTPDVVVDCGLRADEEPRCRAVARSSGTTLVDGALEVWPLVEESLAVRDDAHALVRRETDGRSVTLAPWAADVGGDERGRALAVVAAHGDAAPLPGEPTVIARFAPDGAREILVADPLASRPISIPGADDVVYVSSMSGVPSVWRTERGSARQLTNLATPRLGQEYVPVPGRQHTWVADGRTLVFTVVDDETSELWTVDVVDGTTQRLGPGATPVADGDGVIARVAGGSGDCAARYLDDAEGP